MLWTYILAYLLAGLLLAELLRLHYARLGVPGAARRYYLPVVALWPLVVIAAVAYYLCRIWRC